MRTLSATLLAGQKARTIRQLAKIVLTREKLLHAGEVTGTGNAANAEQAFTSVDCTGATKANSFLVIDLKCTDPTKLGTTHQIELTSSGGADTNEWHIPAPISEITTSWTTFTLALEDAETTGGELDVTAIDYLRWYNYSTDGDVTIYWKKAYIRYLARTYTKTRILDGVVTEEGDRQSAQVILDNTSKEFNSLSLQGYRGVISKGVRTSGGNEYSAKAPFKVVAQQSISFEQGDLPGLQCVLTLAGIPNLIAEDKASGEYTPDEDDTDTVKTTIRKLAGDSGATILSVYNHCDSYDVVFDSEDSLIDSLQLKDSFSVQEGASRWAKIKEAIGNTKCVIRAEADGKLHVSVPVVTTSTAWVADTSYSLGDTIIPTTANDYEYICTTAGTSDSSEPTWTTGIGDTIDDNDMVWTVSYDYEYSLASGYHTFFSKSYRKRLVIPNYIVVQSLKSQDTEYTGYAEDTDSSDIMEIRKPYRRRVSSNQQCTDIAAAILSRIKRNAEKGNGFVPMNVGAEVYDFVKITDRRQGDYRAGNIGYIRDHYRADSEEWTTEFRFGSLSLEGLMGTAPPLGAGGTSLSLQELWQLYYQMRSWILELIEDMNGLTTWMEYVKGFIWLGDEGDVIINPKDGRWTINVGHLGVVSGRNFGLFLAESAATLHWYDKGGTLDHVFGPETTGHGKLGSSTYRWKQMVTEDINASEQAICPLGLDKFR